MKRSLCLVLLVLAFGAAGCGGGDSTASLGSDDVAVVGSEPITKEQFQSLMGRAQKSYEAQKRDFPKPETLRSRDLHQYLVLRGGIRAEESFVAWCDEVIDALRRDNR